MKCRICHSNEISNLGILKPYLDYECEVFECSQCSSRFVEYDESIYEKLHSNSSSSYASHEEIALEVSRLYRRKNLNGIRKKLCEIPKFKFIIELIESRSDISKILEVGCSKGYLSAYFHARGYDITGIDISETAISFAKREFGDFFRASDSQQIKSENISYDAIIHTGTIGCVKSPFKLTHDLLCMLRPSGILAFNSPNVMVCKRQEILWAENTSPPDLVTLFHESFWRDNFSDFARVEVSYGKAFASQVLSRYLRRRNDYRQNSKQQKLFDNLSDSSSSSPSLGKTKWDFKVPIKYAKGLLNNRLLSPLLISILPKYELEFGMYVLMTRLY